MHMHTTGVQCLIDSLVRGAENGCKASKELIDILNSEDVDDFDSDVAKISQLFYSVAKAGCIFKQDSIFYTSIKDMDDNDQVSIAKSTSLSIFALFASYLLSSALSGPMINHWKMVSTIPITLLLKFAHLMTVFFSTECVYIIVASKKKRRVTVIFRGTTTLNDIIKNVDFDILPKPNPIDDDYPGKTDLINLNCGYGEFLFTKRDDTGKTKFDEITDRANEYGNSLVRVATHSML